MLPNDVEARIKLLQARIEAIRTIIDASAQEDLREVLLEMVGECERALADLNAQKEPTIHRRIA